MSQEKVWDKLAKRWNQCRQRPVEEAILFLKNKKGKVLDLCCGSGRNIFKQKNLNYYGVDFSKNMLRYAKEKARKLGVKAKLKKANMTALPFKDDFFETCIFISSLHCLKKEEERQKALSELFRVLKKKGEAMISVWDKNKSEKLKKIKGKEAVLEWQGKKRDYYFFNKKELAFLLKKTGFKIMKNRWKGHHCKKNITFFVKK